MFDEHYDFILQYLATHQGTIPVIIDMNTHLSRATISATIEELKAKGFIDPTGESLYLTDKAVAYLEQKGLIVLKKEIQSRKLERLRDFRKKSKQNKIPAIHKQPIAKRIKSISLADWGVIATIMSLIIAIFYVIKAILEN